jgi:hypothetical protein
MSSCGLCGLPYTKLHARMPQSGDLGQSKNPALCGFWVGSLRDLHCRFLGQAGPLGEHGSVRPGLSRSNVEQSPPIEPSPRLFAAGGPWADAAGGPWRCVPAVTAAIAPQTNSTRRDNRTYRLRRA